MLQSEQNTPNLESQAGAGENEITEPGVEGAITGIGLSELRPYRASSRSACSIFVGIPVDGPAR